MKDCVGLSDAQRRERAAELRRIQEEKDRKMRELQVELRADRTDLVRPPFAAFCASSSRGGFLGGNGVLGCGQQAPQAGAQDIGPAASCSPEQDEQAAATRSPAVAAANAAAATSHRSTAAANAAAARAAAVSPPAAPTASTSAAVQTRHKELFVPLPSPSRPQFNEGGISEEERRCRAADIKRLQAEREQARRNIATEFRADHHFRGGAQAARDSDTASTASAASSAPPRDALDTCLVQLRLPTGAMSQKTFKADDQLSAVTEYAHDVLREHGIYESCKLVLPPRQIMGEEEAGKSLYDLSLLPRVAFTVQLQSADGRVTSAPAAGSEFEAAFVNELTGMLESEGFTGWEAAQWGALVQGQLQHGEMRQVRANVGALFGGLRLPSTISAWAKRVDNAPQMPRPPKTSDAALRFRRELSMCSDLDKERLGFEILPLPAAAEEPGHEPIPAPLVCTLRIHKLPPASALSRDLALLASEHSMPQELVLQLHFGADFPFMGPLVRVVYPILRHVPIVVGTTPAQGQATESLHLGGNGHASAEVPHVSVGMALQANAVAVALQGCRCGVWALPMGQSFPRYAAWLRNWLMGCGARVDTALSAQIAPQGGAGAGGCKSNWYLPTIGGLWQGMRVVVEDRMGSGWHVSLPARLRVEVQEKMQVDAKGDGSGRDVDMTASSGGGAQGEAANMDGDHQDDEGDQEVEEEIDPEVESLKKRALWVVEPVSFVELSTLGSWQEGGGRMSVGPVSSWDAADGTVVISPHIAASLGIMGPVSEGGKSDGGEDIKLQVRGVEVREATRVLCRCVS